MDSQMIKILYLYNSLCKYSKTSLNFKLQKTIEHNGKSYRLVNHEVVSLPKALSAYIKNLYFGRQASLTNTAKKQLHECPFSVEELLMAVNDEDSNVKMNKCTYREINIKQTGGTHFDIALDKKKVLYIGKNRQEQIYTMAEVENFDFKNKTVGLINGCYCPPHKGHFETIHNACVKNKLDVLFINSTNREENARHGLPLSVTVKILSIYARYLNDRYNIDIIIGNAGTPNNISADMKQLVVFEVIELHRQPNDEDLAEAALKEKSHPLDGTTRAYLRNFDKKDPKVIHSVLFRDESNGLSATLFVKSMMKFFDTKNKKDKDNASTFLPDFLSEKDKNVLLDNMISEYGPVMIGDKSKS